MTWVSKLRPMPWPRRLGRDGHLREFVNAVTHRNESGAADGSAFYFDHVNMAALAEDGAIGVAQDFAVFGFECEVARDPFLVECLECSGVVVVEQWANGYVGHV